MPQSISSGDLEEVYRRVYFATGSTACNIEPLTYPEFVNACCMTAMAMYDQVSVPCIRALESFTTHSPEPLFSHSTHPSLFFHDTQKNDATYKTVEAKVEAFFSTICGLPKPFPTPLPLSIAQSLAGQTPSDAYKEWWDLAATFEEPASKDPTAFASPSKERIRDYKEWWEVGASLDNQAAPPSNLPSKDEGEGGSKGKAISYLSSNDYPLLLIQDMILPPQPCPPAVLPLIEKAAFFHNSGKYQEALTAYQDAQQNWIWHIMETERGGRRSGWSGPAIMPLTHRIYFKLMIGSVLMSTGKYREAIECYDSEGGIMNLLPEGHVDRALLHSCRAFALNAIGNLRLAFEELVRAMVMRAQAPSFGPSHVDTQLACHNLGCVLDRLGKNHRALELLQGSMEAFRSALGGDHPRAQVAQRNLNRVRHKCTQLEMHYSSSSAAGTKEGQGGEGNASGPKQMSLQERLAAFRSRTSGTANGEGKRGKKKSSENGNRAISRSPADLTYLGGGIHIAPPDVMAVYERMKPEIALRASGGLDKDLSPSSLLVPRSGPLPMLTSITNGTATGMGADRDSALRQTPSLGFGSLVKGSVNDPTLAPRPQGKRLPGSSSLLPPPPSAKNKLPTIRSPSPLADQRSIVVPRRPVYGQDVTSAKKKGEPELTDKLGQILYNR